MLARYFMFSQVYFHPTRLIHDVHLRDFLREWLPDGRFPIDVHGHLAYTDNEITAAMIKAADQPDAPGHDPARRIMKRDHFRIAYQRKAEDIGQRALATRAIYEAACDKFGPENVRYGASPKRPDPPAFPVLERDGTSTSSLALSEVLNQLPASRDEYVFVARPLRREAERWADAERERIIEEAINRQATEAEEETGEIRSPEHEEGIRG
jgi:uncharacterized protein